MKFKFLKFSQSMLAVILLTAFIQVPIFAQKKQNSKKIASKKRKAPAPSKQSSQLPHIGASIQVLPEKAVVIRHQNNSYHFENGIFYKPVGESFVTIAPPIGIVVPHLPKNYFHFSHLGRPYYYYYGTFYAPYSKGGYMAVSPPLGARIHELPAGYKVVNLDAQVYYRWDETYYKAVLGESSAPLYEVVKGT